MILFQDVDEKIYKRQVTKVTRLLLRLAMERREVNKQNSVCIYYALLLTPRNSPLPTSTREHTHSVVLSSNQSGFVEPQPTMLARVSLQGHLRMANHQKGTGNPIIYNVRLGIVFDNDVLLYRPHLIAHPHCAQSTAALSKSVRHKILFNFSTDKTNP